MIQNQVACLSLNTKVNNPALLDCENAWLSAMNCVKNGYMKITGTNISYSAPIIALSIAYSLAKFLVKILFFLAFLGLFLNLVPDEFLKTNPGSDTGGWFLASILWLTVSSPYLMGIGVAFLVRQILQRVNEIEKEQYKQSMLLGGLVNYFEQEEPQLPVERNPEKYSREVNIETMLSDWISKRWVDSTITRIEQGIDPFESKFKRGAKFTTVLKDFQRY